MVCKYTGPAVEVTACFYFFSHFLEKLFYLTSQSLLAGAPLQTPPSFIDSFGKCRTLFLPCIYGAATPKRLEMVFPVIKKLFCIGLGLSSSQRISISHHWFQSQGNFGELVFFCRTQEGSAYRRLFNFHPSVRLHLVQVYPTPTNIPQTPRFYRFRTPCKINSRGADQRCPRPP